ncbi:MAG: precorrin-8X methylmutase [Verrucomicrobia bacterium]|nr:precorrin-8X methylmutase [Verrucomicrobiota bacterium]
MKTAYIHQFLKAPLSGVEIEQRSFAAIDREVSDRRGFSGDQWEIVRRMIHTSGDASLIKEVRFSSNAIRAGVDALRAGAALYVDSNMIRAGLSLPRLQSANAGYSAARIFCHIAEEEVAQEAGRTGLPRSLFAVRKAKGMLHGGIAVFGNAPVALLELNRMIMEGEARPALVVAMPVGFVHVLESKEEIMSLDVPCVTIEGRRGGSTLAVSVVHAFCTLASRTGGRWSAKEAERNQPIERR